MLPWHPWICHVLDDGDQGGRGLGPLADDHYSGYWDAAFLKRLELDEHVDALAKFWPSGRPRWDALALVSLPGEPEAGVLLTEGKSYPDEMLKGSVAGATDPDSRRAIEHALAWT